MNPAALPLRAIALVLVLVLGITVATPARAEADPLAVLAIVSLVVIGVIVVVYLIAANVGDSRRAGDDAPVVWVALPAQIPASQTP
jgi:hypothetical protein